MLHVDADKAKARFAELLARVESGEEITITRHDMPVAILAPIKKAHTAVDRRAAIERMKALSKGVSLGGRKIRDLINDGRR